MDTRPVSFRLSKSEFDALAAAAQMQRMTPGAFARDLVRRGISGKTAAEEYQPISKNALRQIIGRAAYAIIVALSPDMDEKTTKEFLDEEFDSHLLGN